MRELAETVARVLGFSGQLVFRCTAKPDGTPRKLMDVSRFCIALAGTIRLVWNREWLV